MDPVLTALALVAEPTTLLAILLGTILGVVVGALPGLGSVIAVAIVLPFTFTLGQAASVALLVAVYCGSVYGGSVSAILINTPGTPQSAATTLDGFPMARRGEADRALGWATSASVFGGLFSCFVLILVAPQLAAIALRFGPVETFALIVMALTCIATVSADNVIRGLIAGAIGLFLATVGADPVVGEMRFTFGYFPLNAGLNLIAVVVGVFALSEVLWRLGERGGAAAAAIPRIEGMKLPGLAEWKGRSGVLLKSSALGSFIGVLPGTGAATAAFVAYAEAKRGSRNGANFGNGEPDGIIAPEAANNAVTGGALVPTLALGIPGDAVTAVMLSALLIQGVTPGVRLMTENPHIVYATFFSLILVNLVMLVFALAAAKGFARLLRMPEPLLLAFVVLFCFIGTWGVRGNALDLLVMVGSGFLGFGLRLFGYPLAPLVIGLVLGPQLELSLRQALILTDGSLAAFFAGPIAVLLFLLAALTPAWPALAGLWRRARV